MQFLGRSARIVLVVSILSALSNTSSAQIPAVDHAKQGTLMLVQLNNVGTFGRTGYPPFSPGIPANVPPESLGLEYPVGLLRKVEHIYGGGLWVGGLRDTSRGGGGVPLRGVSVTYEGWAGPYFEFFPGSTPADTIWMVNRLMPTPPSNWDAYWGAALPFRPVSDQEFHCVFTDTAVRVALHDPLGLRVIQSSYIWDDPAAEGVMIIEYRIINIGQRQLDSVYVALFLDGDVGPITVSQYYNHNYSASMSGLRGAYIHNPIDSLSTPVGALFLGARLGGDSIVNSYQSFQWFPGSATPPDDVGKYAVISADTSRPDEYPGLSETRFVLSAGPFTLTAGGLSPANPLTVAFALLASPSGDSAGVETLRMRALIAQDLYSTLLLTGVTDVPEPLPPTSALSQNYPNPFNPTTNIQFTIVNRQLTIVKVFDLLGREIATLVNEVKEPGTYTVQWNASEAASGAYFYRLRAGDFIQTRRLMLLK